jgi:hypothetical protein
MNRQALILAILMASSAANAQVALPPTPAASPKAPPPTSLYCLPASAGFLESDAKASDEMRKCAKGDTIVVPARNPGAVARMCDFSKSIAAFGESVVCVMVFPERTNR